MLDFDDLKRLPDTGLEAAWLLLNPGIQNGVTLRGLKDQSDLRLVIAYFRACFVPVAEDGVYHFFVEDPGLTTEFLPPKFQSSGVQVYDYGSLPKLVRLLATRVLDVSILKEHGSPFPKARPEILKILVGSVSDRHTFKLL